MWFFIILSALALAPRAEGDLVAGAPLPGQAFPPLALVDLRGKAVTVPDPDRVVVVELIRSADW